MLPCPSLWRASPIVVGVWEMKNKVVGKDFNGVSHLVPGFVFKSTALKILQKTFKTVDGTIKRYMMPFTTPALVFNRDEVRQTYRR